MARTYIPTLIVLTKAIIWFCVKRDAKLQEFLDAPTYALLQALLDAARTLAGVLEEDVAD